MLTNILPSYLYQQYNNDPDLLAFFTAYNNESQTRLDTTNNLNLPNYTTKNGLLLDWVALGIYGIKRPVLPYNGVIGSGVYNEQLYNTAIYNSNIIITPSGFYETTDDIFKRIITWNFYKGDGYQFDITWLKNRIYRFLGQVNGIPLPIPNTYDIGINVTTDNVVNIYINSASDLATLAPIMEAGINSGALQVPFGYTFNIFYENFVTWENNSSQAVIWNNSSSNEVTWFSTTI